NDQRREPSAGIANPYCRYEDETVREVRAAGKPGRDQGPSPSRHARFHSATARSQNWFTRPSESRLAGASPPSSVDERASHARMSSSRAKTSRRIANAKRRVRSSSPSARASELREASSTT